MKTEERIMAIYPTPKGYSFLILQHRNEVIDWGNVISTNIEHLKNKYYSLIKTYYIDRVISESFASESKRGSKARNMVRDLKEVSRHLNLKHSSYTLSKVSEVFESFGAYTKYQRAEMIAEVLHPLFAILPNKRKIYQSEHLAMFVFDCGALILTHL